jgi:hypothetical protein
MPSAPLPPEEHAAIQDLARALREVVDAEINELATNHATAAGDDLYGPVTGP